MSVTSLYLYVRIRLISINTISFNLKDLKIFETAGLIVQMSGSRSDPASTSDRVTD